MDVDTNQSAMFAGSSASMDGSKLGEKAGSDDLLQLFMRRSGGEFGIFVILLGLFIALTNG